MKRETNQKGKKLGFVKKMIMTTKATLTLLLVPATVGTGLKAS